jgi:phage recombination protein Bet
MNPQTTPPQTAPTSKGMSKSDFEMLLEKDVKTSVWIEPFGAQPGDEIKMSVPLIRRYIAVPAWDKQKQEEIPPTDEECVKFLMLCNARRLNPFEGDAYMIPFYDTSSGKHKWSLITAHSAFLKRAELHPYYDGMESGIIVERKGDILDLPGDFRLDSDKLLGGWSIVHNKNHSHPSIKRVKLTTYVKSFGVWIKDPEGMICKVAEAQNVRDSFPTLIGGMYLREEIESDDFQRLVNQEVKRPAFNGPTPPGLPEPDRTTQPVDAIADLKRTRKRPTMVEQPLNPPTSVPQDAQANPTAAPVVSTVPPTPPAIETIGEKELRELNDALKKLCADNQITEEQLIAYMRAEKWMKPAHKRPSDLSTTMLKGFVKGWQGAPVEMVKRIKGEK